MGVREMVAANIVKRAAAAVDNQIRNFGVVFVRKETKQTFKAIQDNNAKSAEDHFASEIFNNQEIKGRTCVLFVSRATKLEKGEIITEQATDIRWQIIEVKPEAYPERIQSVAFASIAPMV